MIRLTSSRHSPKFWTHSLFIVMAFLLSGCDDPKESGNSQNVIMVGTSADMPPFEFFKDQEIVGYDIDVIRAVAKKMDKQIRIQDMDFSALIPALQSGRIQIAISSLTPNPERRQVIDFSKPYLTLPLAIIARGNDDLSNVENLQGKIIGVQLGSTHEQYARELAEKSSITIKSLNKLPELIESLKNGHVDGVILETTTALSFQENNPQLKIFLLSDLDVSFSIAFPKGSDLVDEVNEAIEALRAEGVLEKLRDKWFKTLDLKRNTS